MLISNNFINSSYLLALQLKLCSQLYIIYFSVMKFGLLVAIFGMAVSNAQQLPQTQQNQVRMPDGWDKYPNNQIQMGSSSQFNRPQTSRTQLLVPKSQLGRESQGFNPNPQKEIQSSKTLMVGEQRPQTDLKPLGTVRGPLFPYYQNQNQGFNQINNFNRPSRSLDRYENGRGFAFRPSSYGWRWPQTDKRRRIIRDQDESSDDDDKRFDWRKRPQSEDRRGPNIMSRREDFRPDFRKKEELRDPRFERKNFAFDRFDRDDFRRGRSVDVRSSRRNDDWRYGQFDFDKRRGFSVDRRERFDGRRGTENNKKNMDYNQALQRFEAPNRPFLTFMPFHQFHEPIQRPIPSTQPFNKNDAPQFKPKPFEQPIQNIKQLPQQSQQLPSRPQSQLFPQSQSQPQPYQAPKIQTLPSNPINDFRQQQEQHKAPIQQNNFPWANFNNLNSNTPVSQPKPFVPVSQKPSPNILPKPIEVPQVPQVFRFNNWNNIAPPSQNINVPKPAQFPF